MYYFARRCGYWQAKAISGGTFADNNDHGWMELELNGVRYLFDPRSDSRFYKQYGMSGPGMCYMITYDKAPWPYFRP